VFYTDQAFVVGDNEIQRGQDRSPRRRTRARGRDRGRHGQAEPSARSRSRSHWPAGLRLPSCSGHRSMLRSWNSSTGAVDRQRGRFNHPGPRAREDPAILRRAGTARRRRSTRGMSTSSFEKRPSAEERADYRTAHRDVAVDVIGRYNSDAGVCVGVPFGHTCPQWIPPYGDVSGNPGVVVMTSTTHRRSGAPDSRASAVTRIVSSCSARATYDAS